MNKKQKNAKKKHKKNVERKRALVKISRLKAKKVTMVVKPKIDAIAKEEPKSIKKPAAKKPAAKKPAAKKPAAKKPAAKTKKQS